MAVANFYKLKIFSRHDQCVLNKLSFQLKIKLKETTVNF